MGKHKVYGQEFAAGVYGQEFQEVEDWPSCGNCGRPVQEHIAKKNGGFCEDCTASREGF